MQPARKQRTIETKITNPSSKVGHIGPAQLSIIAKQSHVVSTVRTAGIDTRLPGSEASTRIVKNVKRFGGR